MWSDSNCQIWLIPVYCCWHPRVYLHPPRTRPDLKTMIPRPLLIVSGGLNTSEFVDGRSLSYARFVLKNAQTWRHLHLFEWRIKQPNLKIFRKDFSSIKPINCWTAKKAKQISVELSFIRHFIISSYKIINYSQLNSKLYENKLTFNNKKV